MSVVCSSIGDSASGQRRARRRVSFGRHRFQRRRRADARGGRDAADLLRRLCRARSSTSRRTRNASRRSMGSEHTAIRLTERDLLDALPEALAAMDQPTGDGVNTYIVSRAVRQTGLTVALSGLGGDELFGGYPRSSRLPRVAEVAQVLGPIVRADARLRGRARCGSIGGASVLATKAAAADGIRRFARRALSADAPAVHRGAAPVVVRARLAIAICGCRGSVRAASRSAFARMPGSGPVAQVSYAEVAHLHARRAAA